jgi:hypothetical protein
LGSLNSPKEDKMTNFLHPLKPKIPNFIFKLILKQTPSSSFPQVQFKYGVPSIPTLMVLSTGKKVNMIVGMVSKSAIDSVLILYV